MVGTVFLNKSKEYKISQEFLIYLRILEDLEYLRMKKYITDNEYLNASVQFKKLYIGKK